MQGIKRGLMELADALAFNKADGDNATRARQAAATYDGALRLLHPADAAWKPRVLTTSGQEGTGVADVWQAIIDHRAALEAAGTWQAHRAEQRVRWLWDRLDDGLRQALREDHNLVVRLQQAEADARAGTRPPTVVAREVLAAFLARAT